MYMLNSKKDKIIQPTIKGIKDKIIPGEKGE